MFGRRRVLIVDGGAAAREEYPTWLMEAGHDTSVVDDASRALILAPLLRPDVIVIDFEHLGADVEWLQALRQRLEATPVHVIGLAPVQIEARAFARVAHDVDVLLTRPLVKAGLLDVVVQRGGRKG